MHASPLAPPTSRRRQQLAPAPRNADRRRPHAASAVVGSLLVAMLAGCSGDANGHSVDPLSTATGIPSIAPTVVDEEAALLAQYRTFWASLTPISRMPAAERRAVLAKLAVDPALKSLLFGMTQADAKGQVFYGTPIPRPTARINPDDTTALVRDCQDGRQAGLAEKASGKRLTVGVARNHVSVTMKKQPGEQWKVAFVDYAKSPC